MDGEQIVLSLPVESPLYAVDGAIRLVFGENEETMRRLIVIRSEDGKYHAFANHCTHNEKELYYLNEGKVLRCHSGRSYFDLEGNVMMGPADRPLRIFTTWQEDDQLTIEMKS